MFTAFPIGIRSLFRVPVQGPRVEGLGCKGLGFNWKKVSFSGFLLKGPIGDTILLSGYRVSGTGDGV